jgi:Domain of unknown function (DUF4398)
MVLRFKLPVAILLMGMGCASTSAPSAEKTASSSASIRAAEEVGATHSPTAALHLQLAKEEFEHARTLTGPNDKARAERLLMRAQADAELSLALARGETEKAEASGAIAQVKALKASANP